MYCFDIEIRSVSRGIEIAGVGTVSREKEIHTSLFSEFSHLSNNSVAFPLGKRDHAVMIERRRISNNVLLSISAACHRQHERKDKRHRDYPPHIDKSSRLTACNCTAKT